MEYTIVIRQAPDNFYIACCPLLPEARAQGKTYQECLANMAEAVHLCLAFRKGRGEEIPEEEHLERITVAV